MHDLIMYALERAFVEDAIDFVCFPEGESAEDLIGRLERLRADRERFRNYQV